MDLGTDRGRQARQLEGFVGRTGQCVPGFDGLLVVEVLVKAHGVRSVGRLFHVGFNKGFSPVGGGPSEGLPATGSSRI